MHEERNSPQRSAEVLSLVKQDKDAERSVLQSIIAAYPELFTENELVREIADNWEDVVERDTIERAIRSLAVVGLLHRCHPIIVPTRAALRFEALEGDS
jgi:hypothetical protein